jgi:hypothetical protein
MTFPAQDKLLHFIAGAAISVAFGIAGHPALGITAAFVVGAAKEVWDHFNPPHTVDALDFFATALGGVAGAIARINL